MRTTIARSATAVVVGAGLALGLAACSDDAKNAAESAVATASEGAAQATSAVEGAVGGDAVDIEGKQVPKLLADKYAEAGGAGALGALQEVTEEGGSQVAVLDNARIYDVDGTAVVVKGEILNHWLARGGVDSDLGKPLSDEAEMPEGWKQEFQNGSMSWTHNGDLQFFETVELHEGVAPAPAEGEQAPAPAEGAPAPAEGAPAPAPAEGAQQ